MTTAYTQILGLALPATGELSGTWGDIVNNYISTYVDSSVGGSLTVTTDVTLTKTTNAALGSTSTQYAVIVASPASVNITITAPTTAAKPYIVINTSGTYTVTFKASGQTGVVIAANERCVVAFNGTDYVKVSPSVVSGVVPVASGGTNSSVAGIGSFNNITGYSASGATGTTSTNLVFSTSPTITTPTLVTPALGTPGSGTLTNCTVDGTNSVGYLNIPQNSQSTSYTTVLADAGKHIYHPTTDANSRTYTIDGNVAYPIGTVISFVNMTAQSVTIALSTGTLYFGYFGTTGSRTLGQYGVANALKMTSTTWIITGTALT